MPKWFHISQKLGLAPNYSPSMFRTKVPISLKLSLASYYPSTLFLSFRSIWGSWSQLITHTQKHWVWHQNQVYQSNNFTPWSCSWPPTAPPPCSWPSDQSEALVNGPKLFSIPKNHGLDTKLKCLAWTEAKLQYMQVLAQNTHFRPKFSRHRYMGVNEHLCKKLWVPLDQYIPEHLLKPVNYQEVGKNNVPGI